MAARLVVFGDSVPWGQGFLRQHTFAQIVADALHLSVDMRAHSGAIIGARALPLNTVANGEVPFSYPTILQQVDEYEDAVVDVAVVDVAMVLVNGGINDVDIRTILNPLTEVHDLRSYTQMACNLDMTGLLATIAEKFPAPTRIVVIGYYIILSAATDAFGIAPMLAQFSLLPPSQLNKAPIVDKLVQLCAAFASESESSLSAAVGNLGQSRCVFASPGFTAQNAVFAPQALLFGLADDSAALDEVISQRETACDAFFRDPWQILSREQCHRASAGHPTVAGGAQIAQQILGALPPV